MVGDHRIRMPTAALEAGGPVVSRIGLGPAANGRLTPAGGPPAPQLSRPAEGLPDWSRQLMPGMAPVPEAGPLAGFSRTQRSDVLVPPGVGEHSTQILHEAGLSDQAIRNLPDQSVVRAGEPRTIPAVAPYR
jgi:hypothetical protein